MDAEQAIQELLEVSPQIEAAVLLERDGSVLSSSMLSTDERTSRLASLSTRLLQQAETARAELSQEPVVQCEVATGKGSVFVVADSNHIGCAVTGNDATVGLVFYDLKTALRGLREQEGGDDSTAAQGGGETNSATGIGDSKSTSKRSGSKSKSKSKQKQESGG